MASTLPAATMATRTYSSRESTCTTTRPQVGNLCRALYWSTSSPAPWTRFDPARSDKCSDLTTSCSDRAVPATTGRRDTIQREPSLSTVYSTLSARRPRAATVYRASS